MFDYDKRSSILLSILAIVLISYAPAHAGGLKVDKRVTLAPTGNTVAGPGIVPALPIGGGDLTIYDNERESNLVGTLHCIQGNMRIFLQATTPGALLKAGDAINGRTIAMGADGVNRVQVRCLASGTDPCDCIWRIDELP